MIAAVTASTSSYIPVEEHGRRRAGMIEGLARGWKLSTIAARLGMPLPTLRHWLDDHARDLRPGRGRRPLDTADWPERIRAARGRGLAWQEVAAELGVHREDDALLVMPMCHANSVNFFAAFAYCGGVTSIYSRPSFDAEHCVRTLGESGATFTSLVPTHYIMMLGLTGAARRQDLGRVSKLMISSAPARADTKREVMEMFPNSGLFELYGSSECGWVTMLRPQEQQAVLRMLNRKEFPIAVTPENELRFAATGSVTAAVTAGARGM